jgi:DNA polymerase-4
VITVEIKTDRLNSYTHQRRLHNATNITGEIYSNVVLLFNEAWKGERIRHLGVRITDLCCDEYMQASIFDEKNAAKKQALDTAIDSIRGKYGNTSVMRAIFADYEFSPMTGGPGAEDYPVMSSIL